MTALTWQYRKQKRSDSFFFETETMGEAYSVMASPTICTLNIWWTSVHSSARANFSAQLGAQCKGPLWLDANLMRGLATYM